MADWYVYPDATGANDGTSTTDAWTDLQSAFDAYLATTIADGDTIFCRGTQTLTTSILIKKYAVTINRIKFIGVNDSWVNDRITQFTLDADSTATNALNAQTYGRYHYYENFAFINAVDHGFNAEGSNASLGSYFINCSFNNNGNRGFAGGVGSSGSKFYRCVFNNNITIGVFVQYGIILCCVAKNNGSVGIYLNNTTTVVFCIAHANASRGFTCIGNGSSLFGCISDGNTSVYGHGFWDQTSNGSLFVGCRATNNEKYGFYSNLSTNVLENCAYRNNTLGDIGGAVIEYNSVLLSADGYVDRANDNFNLTPEAEARGYEISIDTLNKLGISAGLQTPEDYNLVGNVLSGVVFNTSLTGTYVVAGSSPSGSSEYYQIKCDDPGNELLKLRIKVVIASTDYYLIQKPVAGGYTYALTTDATVLIPYIARNNISFYTDETVEDIYAQWVNPNDVGSSWIKITDVAPDYTTGNNIRDGVTQNFGAIVGDMALTTANNLRNGVGIGSNATEVVGDIDLTTANNLRDGIGIGSGGTEVVGDIDLTSADNLRDGIGIGSGGTEVVGDILLTTADNLRNGIGIGSGGTEVVGDIVIATAAQLKYGEKSGSGGTEVTGTYKGNQFAINVELIDVSEKYLNTPARTFSIQGTIVFADTITGVSLTLEYKKPGAAAWTSIGSVTSKNFVKDVSQNIEDLFSTPTVQSGASGDDYIIRLTPSKTDDIFRGDGQKAWGTRTSGVGVAPSKPANISLNIAPSKPIIN